MSPLYVTSPFLPPLSEYISELEGIWDRRILTNAGPLHELFSTRLAAELQVPRVTLTNNGETALSIAIAALAKRGGEIVTTPYSFVGTTHAIAWGGCTPVFADIGHNSFNLDPERVLEKITPSTVAIMPVHCYGYAADVHAFKKISSDYGIPIIYDAAHAFGVLHDGRSLLQYGDASILSFHATKVFNTVEGGAIVSPHIQLQNDFDAIRNFGIVDEITVSHLGTNGKLNEFQAAMGLVNLRYVDAILRARQSIFERYNQAFAECESITTPPLPSNDTHNFGYYPIVVQGDAARRESLYLGLKEAGIFSRRYFFPLITDFPMYSTPQDNYPNARYLSDRVLCLPIYPTLSDTDVDRIAAEVIRICKMISI